MSEKVVLVANHEIESVIQAFLLVGLWGFSPFSFTNHENWWIFVIYLIHAVKGKESNVPAF